MEITVAGMEFIWPTGRVFITALNMFDILLFIQENLFQWNVPQNAKVELLTFSENGTFVVTTKQQRFIMRLYRQDYHQDCEILSELLWLEAIGESKIVEVPHLYKTKSGQRFLNIDGQRLALFSYLEGQEPKPFDHLAPWFETLGMISAKLHGQSKNWQKPQNFCRKHWTYETMIGENALWGNWRNIEYLNKKDMEILYLCAKQLKNFSENFPKDEEHFGLIHGDLRLANLLVDGQNLKAIDFDDCGFSWFVQDLANAISFFEDDGKIPNLIQAWFQGYQHISPVTNIMKKMLPHLIMMRRLQLTAWLESHKNVPTAKELRPNYAKVTIELAKFYLKYKDLAWIKFPYQKKNLKDAQ